MAPHLAADHPPPDWDPLHRAGVMSLDMESALLFVAGRVLGLAVAAMCLVTVKAGPPPEFMDSGIRVDLERRLIEAALDGLVTYELED
jgi:uridine phosphorylase